MGRHLIKVKFYDDECIEDNYVDEEWMGYVDPDCIMMLRQLTTRVDSLDPDSEELLEVPCVEATLTDCDSVVYLGYSMDGFIDHLESNNTVEKWGVPERPSPGDDF